MAEDLKLFPHQEEGIEFLVKRRYALLAFEMGLGKTATAIRAADEIDAENVFVICPASVKENWAREFRKFSKKKRMVRVVESRQGIFSGVSIVSYDFFTQNRQVLLGGRIPGRYALKFDLVIVDESHFLKEPTAKRTLAVYGKDGLIRRTKRYWALSGTPVPNHAGELWPFLFTVGATRLNYEQFIDRFCHVYRSTLYSKPRVSSTRKEMIPELRELLKKGMLRRKKSEVLKELPPIFYRQLFVKPGKVALDEETKHKILEEVEKLEAAFRPNLSDSEILTILEVLSPSVSSLRRYNGIRKAKPVCDQIREEISLNLYDKVVLFGIHKDVLRIAKEALKKFKPVVVDGSTRNRQEAIDAFQNDPATQVFIGNIQAAGTGLTLTAAHNVVFIEQDWVPGNNAQAAMRCHRIGQQNSVFVRYAAIPNSIDEKISATLARKSQEISMILD